MVRRAAAVGLSVIALTDHDSVSGLRQATDVGAALGVQVIAGCELSVAGPQGELHLLAYAVPFDDPAFGAALARAREARAERGREMVRRIGQLGIAITEEDVTREARGAPLGRPHVARALVARRVVRSIDEAFERLLGRGRPGYVPKDLVPLEEATALVRRVGGVSSAAHLGARGVTLAPTLAAQGVDGLEVIHPRHTAPVRADLERAARAQRMLPTGGSDWHGGDQAGPSHGELGAIRVPAIWADAIRGLASERRTG